MAVAAPARKVDVVSPKVPVGFAAKTNAVARAARTEFEAALKPQQAETSPWGRRLSPVEARTTLALASRLIHDIIASVPPGSRMPGPALKVIDDLFKSLREKVPLGVRDIAAETDKPLFFEAFAAMGQPDLDARGKRIWAETENVKTRPDYEALAKTVAALRKR